MATEIILLVLQALYYYLPAYFSNGMPIVFGGGKPLDFGKNWSDGRRIFGDGKTFRGLIFGIGIGTLAFGLIQGNLKLAFFMAVGALLGDLIKSFAKRRLNKMQGEKFWPWDQLDFIIGATLLSSLVQVPRWEYVAIVFVLAPIMHSLTNWGSYKLGLKNVSW